ncbi:MAG: hypothetical protein Tsb0034_09770 [Ekhidna sp.]
MNNFQIKVVAICLLSLLSGLVQGQDLKRLLGKVKKKKNKDISFATSIKGIEDGVFTTNFSDTDDIYLMFELEDPVEEEFYYREMWDGYDISIGISIDESNLTLLNYRDASTKDQKVILPILTDSGIPPGYDYNERGVNTLMEKLIKKGVGMYEISLQVFSARKMRTYEGSFSLTLGNDYAENINRKISNILNSKRAAQARNAQLPNPGRLHNNAQLISDFKKGFIEYFSVEPLKIIITSDEWNINRNEYSRVIEERSAYAVIGWKSKDGLCETRMYYIEQLYMSGKWGDKAFSSSSSGQYSGPIDCKKLIE